MTPRSEKLNETLRTESQTKILDSALALFAQHGFDRTSVAAIAKSASVSQGLIYHYYKSKDDVLRALFERSIRDVQATFQQADAAPTPEEKIARLVQAAFGTVKENLMFWRLSYMLRMQPAVLAALGDDVQGWAYALRTKLTEYLHELRVQHAEIEAAILFALIDGVAQHYALDPQHYPLDKVTERLIRTYRAPRPTRHEGGEP